MTACLEWRRQKRDELPRKNKPCWFQNRVILNAFGLGSEQQNPAADKLRFDFLKERLMALRKTAFIAGQDQTGIEPFKKVQLDFFTQEAQQMQPQGFCFCEGCQSLTHPLFREKQMLKQFGGSDGLGVEPPLWPIALSSAWLNSTPITLSIDCFVMSGAGLQPPRCSPIDNARHPQPEIMRIHMTEASVENQGNHEVQSGAQPHCRFVSMIIGVLMTRMVLATAEIVRFVTIVFSNEPGLNWPHRRGPNADGIADNRNLPAG